MDEKLPIQFIKIPISKLPSLRNDGKFLLIMRLCRYLNQLAFCHQAYLDYSEDSSPLGICQSYNAFMFSCGVLYEAFRVIPKLGKEFSTYKSFEVGFKVFWKDKDTVSIKDTVLNKMRNGVVFHVDMAPIIEAMQTLNLRKLHLITSTTGKIGDSHYQLADDIALNYIIGDRGTPEAEPEYLKETFKKIMDIAVKYITNANKLIGEYVERNHWKVETKTQQHKE
jgi:hypothetical protein